MVKSIVITGGPGAGKTAGITYVSSQLPRQYGVHALTVPEAARIVLHGNEISWSEAHARDQQHSLLALQRPITELQQYLRGLFVRLASEFGREPCVLLFDRGELDGFAYNDPQAFELLLSTLGLSVKSILQSYDAVIHMRPAARGIETSIVDSQWSPDSSLTMDLDARIERAWQQHPRRVVIGETVEWERKRQMLTDTIVRLM
jgi:hypothetical protein